MEKKLHNNGTLLTFHHYAKKEAKNDCSNYRGISNEERDE